MTCRVGVEVPTHDCCKESGKSEDITELEVEVSKHMIPQVCQMKSTLLKLVKSSCKLVPQQSDSSLVYEQTE